MNYRSLIVAVLASGLPLAACNSPEAAPDEPDSGLEAPVPIETGGPGGDLPSMTPPVASEPTGDGSPDLTPPVLTDDAERGEKGARNLLLSWARAIELKEFGQAHAMMGRAGERWSLSEFARNFADLKQITVAVGDGEVDGAAGSLYYASDIVITSTDTEGRPVRIEGPVVLRRVNDVPGASEAQLRWHFDSARLDWTH